jgi:hypothetical protein
MWSVFMFLELPVLSAGGQRLPGSFVRCRKLIFIFILKQYYESNRLVSYARNCRDWCVCWMVVYRCLFKPLTAAWPLKVGPIGCSKRSVISYQVRLINIPEERRAHWSLKCRRWLFCQPKYYFGFSIIVFVVLSLAFPWLSNGIVEGGPFPFLFYFCPYPCLSAAVFVTSVRVWCQTLWCSE